MPRQPRFLLPGYPQHVIQRGNNRQPIFLRNRDFRYFLELLQAACNEQECDLHSYVLMTNHVHFLMTPRRSLAIGFLMQSIGRRYVQYFNKRNGRTGGLWEGRYKASLVDSDRYLLTCYRYIEMNPVRAGLVQEPVRYPWSSYGANAHGEPDPLITPHPLYLALGTNAHARQDAYRKLFRETPSDMELALIRKSVQGCWVLGTDEFIEAFADPEIRPLAPKLRGGDRRSIDFRQRINGV
jgi:putative transposase